MGADQRIINGQGMSVHVPILESDAIDYESGKPKPEFLNIQEVNLDMGIITKNGIDGIEKRDEYFDFLNLFSDYIKESGIMFINNKSPSMIKLEDKVRNDFEMPVNNGKALNTWKGIGISLLLKKYGVIDTTHEGFFDGDSETYSKPLVNSFLETLVSDQIFDFVKATYVRKKVDNDGKTKLFGRARRLYVAPLLDALEEVVGELYSTNLKANKLIKDLKSWGYPLSGEIVYSHDLMQKKPSAQGWAIEIADLIYDSEENLKSTQVDLGNVSYNKNRPLSNDKNENSNNATNDGLKKMCSEIGSYIFSKLKESGVQIDDQFKTKVALGFVNKANEYVNSYYPKMAEENGCIYNQEVIVKEKLAIDKFNKANLFALENVSNSYKIELLPAWTSTLQKRYEPFLRNAISESGLDTVFEKIIDKKVYIFNNPPIDVSFENERVA